MENYKLEIKYTTVGPLKMVAWRLLYEGTDRSPELYVCDYGENGIENNKRLAKKKAEHAKRLTEAALGN